MSAAADYATNFRNHLHDCPHCHQYDPELPATAAVLCPTGAEHMKRWLDAKHREQAKLVNQR